MTTHPYLSGALRDSFERWHGLVLERAIPALRFREVRKGVQALSSLYVERRGRGDLAGRARQGRGKRAALAAYYAPLHFLTACHVLRALGPRWLAGVAHVEDLGCGTGACGAAAALCIEPRPEVAGVDRSGWALAEARRTYAALGLRGRTRRASLAAGVRRGARGHLYVLGWAVNELGSAERAGLLTRLERALGEDGARLLVLEPLARPASPWWRDWSRRLAPLGVRPHELRRRVDLPAWLARMDRAAGLDHRTLGARVLAGPGARRAPQGAPSNVSMSASSTRGSRKPAL